MNKEIIIVGGFSEMIELCVECDYSIIGIIDNNLNLQDSYLGYSIIGRDDDAKKLYKKYKTIPLVLSPDSPLIRNNLFTYYSEFGFTFESVVSPSAKIAKSAKIGEGCVIQHDVNVSSFTMIGDFVKLNTKSNIMHDCSINDFVTVAPNAVILGRINIGKRTYIGANATVLPELEIGEEVIIGAGSVVTKNIPFGTIVKGVPAK